MNLRHVKRVATRRLAYLTARAETSPNSRDIADERDMLDTVLRCLGLLDPERLAIDVANCRERVLPAAARTFARARRGDLLVDQTRKLVADLQRQVGP